MLKLGEKGAIPQNDNETYAIAPHVPCGVVSPELLRRLADVADKYNAKALKITGATRIAVVGIREEDIDKVWEDLAMGPADGHDVQIAIPVDVNGMRAVVVFVAHVDDVLLPAITQAV